MQKRNAVNLMNKIYWRMSRHHLCFRNIEAKGGIQAEHIKAGTTMCEKLDSRRYNSLPLEFNYEPQIFSTVWLK